MPQRLKLEDLPGEEPEAPKRLTLEELPKERLNLEDLPQETAPEAPTEPSEPAPRLGLSDLPPEEPSPISDPNEPPVEPPGKSPVQAGLEAGESLLKGAATTLATIPQVVGSLVREYGEKLEESSDFWDLVSRESIPNLMRDSQALPPGFRHLPLLKRLIESTPQAKQTAPGITEQGKRIVESNRRFIKENPQLFQTPDGKFNEFMADMGSGVTTLAAALGLTLATKSPTAASAMFGVVQKGSLYQEARDAGVPVDEASLRSDIGGALEAGLEFVGLNYFLKKYGGPVMTHLVRAGEEAVQEWSQQFAENVVAANWRQYRTFFDLLNGTGRSALIGGLLGSGASVVVSMAEQSGTIRQLEQFGIPKNKAKELIKSVAEKQEAEFVKAIEPAIKQEIEKKEIDTSLVPESPAKDSSGEELVDLDGNAIPINEDGTVTLYYRTDKEGFDSIKKTGKFPIEEGERKVFFSNIKESKGLWKGEHLVEIKIDPSKVNLEEAYRTDEFGKAEIHIAVPKTKLNKGKIASFIEPESQQQIATPIETPPVQETPKAEKPLTPTATLVKARIDKLVEQQKAVTSVQMVLERQRRDLVSQQRPTAGIDARLKLLANRFHYIDSVIGDILTSQPEAIREELLRSKGEIKLGQLLTAEQRGKKAGIQQGKAEIIEEFRVRGAQIERIRDKIISYAEARLPVSERGKLLKMVRKAKTQRDLLTALHRIDTRGAAVQRASTISELKKSYSDLMDAHNLAVDVKSQIRELINQVELKGHRPETIDRIKKSQVFFDAKALQGEDVEIPRQIMSQIEILSRQPIEEVPTRFLTSMLDRVKLLAQLGKTKLAVRQRLYASEKEAIKNQLILESHPLEARPEIQPAPGERLTMTQKLENAWRWHLNQAQRVDLAITPMSVVFDLLDGLKGYGGLNHRLIKDRIDTSFSRYLDLKDGWINPALKEIGDLGVLNDQSAERIGIHAYRLQVGGRNYLKNAGLTDQQIDEVRLTPQETKAYELMRKVVDEPFPQTKEMVRTVYNREVNKIINYFPVQTDWKKMSDLEIVDMTDAPEFVRLQKNVAQGFTLERKGGQQRIKLNAYDVFVKHMDDVAYFLSMARDAKMLTEIVRSKEYQQSAGKLGQQMVLQWLDVIARKGGSEGEKKIAMLDTLRRNYGAAMLGFKLSSILIQPTALFDGAARIGGRWVFQGFGDVVTNRDVRAFLRDNFPELRNRGGDDPAFLELSDNPTLAKWQARGFWALQKADLVTAGAVTYGAYLKSLAARGILPDLKTVDQQAMREANLALQRTQASMYFKDSPLAISRGALTGNKSVDKLIFQFKTFILTRWSQIRHDAWRAGFRKGDFRQGTQVITWLAAATVAEAGIRASSSKAVQGAVLSALVSGDWDDVEKTLNDEYEDLPKDIWREALGSVPFLGDMVSGGYYRSSVIPSLQFYQNVQIAIQKMQNLDKPANLIGGAIMFAEGLGKLYGIPASSQISQSAQQIIKRLPEPGKRRSRVKRERRERRE